MSDIHSWAEYLGIQPKYTDSTNIECLSSSSRSSMKGPFGLPTPVGAYALAAMRHMSEYGTTHKQLAEVAVATRKWATLKHTDRLPTASPSRLPLLS